jgi:hypothetical protein
MAAVPWAWMIGPGSFTIAKNLAQISIETEEAEPAVKISFQECLWP